MRRISHQERYEDVVLRTKPVLYVPMQGSTTREEVRLVTATVTGARIGRTGPFPGAQSIDFDGADDRAVIATNAAYHPGDTFSVGGWFSRDGAGDVGNAPTMFHNGTNDFIVYFPLSGNTNKLTLRKAGVGDIFATNTVFGSPYTAGWQHCIFTKNAGTATVCYLNGRSESGTYTNQTVVASTSDPTFGIISGALTNDFNGRLSHWAIWNRVLTAAEAVELYRAGKDAT